MSDYPSPAIADSRRLTGPNLYSAGVGALLDVRCAAGECEAQTAAWVANARALAHALGWPETETVIHRDAEGARLFLGAPVDVLMTATDVNEAAWMLAEQPDGLVFAEWVKVLRRACDEERGSQPHLAEVVTAAHARRLVVTVDDEVLTVGSGAGSATWPLALVPAVDLVDWRAIHDIPLALVTGSNGKTTTTRLVAAMWREAGVTPGWSCSDGVWAGARQLESGDFSGPAGARAVLRSADVGAAVLETARGGILRRGLAVNRADAAIITNVSPDHFGEYGVKTVEDLAEVKAVVARALGETGHLVLNADDPLLVALATRLDRTLGWFSTASDREVLVAHVTAGGDAATVRDGDVRLHHGGEWHDLGKVDAMPITLRGAAPHNIANLLGASLVAAVSGVPIDAIRRTLATFGSSASDNPGRLQVYRIGGVTVVVDYAHNPDGLKALCETAMSFPATRRILLLGQAGNRDDDQLRALVQAALGVTAFDHVIIKDMPTLLRGRAPGDVPRVIAAELSRMGVPAARVEILEGELAAVRRAVESARDGDVLVLPVHVEQDGVLTLLRGLRR
ncbi:MAG: Mur ligase family protein [bacterium]